MADSAEFVFLGTMRDEHALPRSMSLLHSLMWKFQIQDMYQRSQCEYYVINPTKTNTRALRRLMTRIHAHYPPSYAQKILEPSYFAVGALGGSRLV